MPFGAAAAAAVVSAYTAYGAAARSNPYLRRAYEHTMVMQRGVPTWCYCEICDRETPHMTYLGVDHCVYERIEHRDLEYSHEFARYVQKASVVRPFSAENDINANATRGRAQASTRDRRGRDRSLATERDCHADARAANRAEVSRQDPSA